MTSKLSALVVAALGTAVVFISVAPADAHSRNKISRTTAHQEAVIENGRRDGSITFLEGRKLRRELKDIEKLKVRLKANDGRLDRSERRVIRKLQSDVWNDIYAERRDKRRRWKGLPRVGK